MLAQLQCISFPSNVWGHLTCQAGNHSRRHASQFLWLAVFYFWVFKLDNRPGKKFRPSILACGWWRWQEEFNYVAQAKRTAVLPQVLYFRAWKLIKDTYYDPKFGDQDWDRWKNKYNGKLKTPDESHKAIETMLFSLGDPYTRFLDKEAFDEEKSQIEAHLFGVGMQLGMNKNHKVVVIAPIENTPATELALDQVGKLHTLTTSQLMANRSTRL